MDTVSDRAIVKEIFQSLHKDEDYKLTFKGALESARSNVPMLTDVAVAVNTHLGGSLGTRSTRKQLQAIMHVAAGNMLMRVNSSSYVPCTYFLPVCANVGSGKSVYYRFMREIMKFLYEGTEVLDRQIFEANIILDPEEEGGNESKKKEKPFVPRQLIRGPGSKEGWELALHKENKIIQIVEEGDLW